jgi:phosphoribosylglycinamide formyltransferase-1
MFDAIRGSGARWVIMGGYLEHLLIPVDFENRVVNIHPSLIPAFCGKGMYGLHVHQAAIDFGVKISGCTVHFVDNQYDHGPILMQRVCEVLEGDTAETLQKRVFELECEALPEAIARIAMAQEKSS